MKLLTGLPDHPRSVVYAMVVAALKADPTLSATIHPDGWRTYLDEDDNSTPPGEDTMPSLEALPFGQGAGPESLVTQQSPLGIAINVATEGLDVRDLLNLWGAVEAALMPGDGSRALMQSIRSALVGTGAQVSDVRLSSPAITPSIPSSSNQVMVASGTISVNMLIRK